MAAGAISRSSSCPPAGFAVGVLVYLDIEDRIASYKINFPMSVENLKDSLRPLSVLPTRCLRTLYGRCPYGISLLQDRLASRTA